MPVKKLKHNSDDEQHDWVGNNAAFTCPICNKVFLVSEHLYPQGRKCPSCNKSIGRVQAKERKGKKAYASIEWIDD